MTEGGFLNYKRGAADVMIVPFNPWILLYFTSHINVLAFSWPNHPRTQPD